MKNKILSLVLFFIGIAPVIGQQAYLVDLNPATCIISKLQTYSPNDLTFSVFPNPNDGNFYLSINNAENSSLNISIYNSFGQLAYTVSHKEIENGELLLNLSFISSGVYFIRIDNNEDIVLKRFIKL